MFHAVRGPLTRSLLQADVPEVYGDPAMLLPMIYTPRAGKRFELGVIPHVVDMKSVQVSDPAVPKIDLQADWRSVIERIVECEAVLTSSLHGLIVAEAYGVPAVWMTVSDRVIGEGFKFRDYYLSTGREPPESLVWKGEPWRMMSRLSEPPYVDTAPLLRAWPAPLGFGGRE